MERKEFLRSLGAGAAFALTFPCLQGLYIKTLFPEKSYASSKTYRTRFGWSIFWFRMVLPVQ